MQTVTWSARNAGLKRSSGCYRPSLQVDAQGPARADSPERDNRRPVGRQTISNIMNQKTFEPSKAHSLDDPQRLTWMPPGEVIERLGLKPGMVVADIGAGTGFFALPLARSVGSGGMVWAVDLQPEMLRLLEEKLRRNGDSGNIRLLEGDAAHTDIADGTCDVAVLANLWHELDDLRAVLAEMRRILRPGGRIAILDWRNDVTCPPGPPLEHRIAADRTEATLRGAGWRNLSLCLLGPYSYFLIASAE
jgi:SAM-dependent methyltransferase